MHWNCLSCTYLGFKACQIQWHLLQVSMISGSWKTGVQNHENGMGHMQQSSLGPFLPLHHVYELYILTFPKKMQKNHNNSKVLVTQNFNIVHCNWHAQKPICADLQAFANTFSCANWHIFQFFVRGSPGNSQNFTFCWFWLGKCIKMAWVVCI